MKLFNIVGGILILCCAFNVSANPCDGVRSGELVADPDDCTRFFICMAGNPITSQCPHLTPVFHNDSCVYGYPETCSPFTTTTELTTTYYTTSEPLDVTETTEHNIETTTIDEFTTKTPSNPPTTTSRPATTTSSPPTTTSRQPTTTSIPIHQCPPSGFGYIPHHTNCNRYFECIRGIRHLRFCPYGLLFDSVTLKCTYPELAVCAGENVATTTQSATSTSTEINIPADFCADIRNSIFPHPWDCSRYILCYYGYPIIISCPDQTIFYNGSCVPGDPTTCQVFPYQKNQF